MNVHLGKGHWAFWTDAAGEDGSWLLTAEWSDLIQLKSV